MKRLWGVALAVLLASGCTQAGMLAGSGEGVCRVVNETHVGIGMLDARVLGLNREFSWSRDLGYYAEGTVRLENTDNEGGWFLVTFNWIGQGLGEPYTQKLSRHLNPGDIGEFKSVLPNIDPQQAVFFTYVYDSYPDSRRVVKRQTERMVCE